MHTQTIYHNAIYHLQMKGNVPTKNKTNKALGRWVSTQRANYKKYKKGEWEKLPRMDRDQFERRIRRLEAIGFPWKAN